MRNWYREIKNLALYGPKGFGKSVPRSNNRIVIASTDVMPATRQVEFVPVHFVDHIPNVDEDDTIRQVFTAPPLIRAEVRTGGSRRQVVNSTIETMTLSEKPSDRTRLRSKRIRARALRNEVLRRGSKLDLNELLPPEEIIEDKVVY